MSPSLPSNIGYGEVVGQFLLVGADSAAVPAQGTVLFTASPAYLIDATASPNPVTILPRPVSCVLDPAGYLRGPDGQLGVYLVATNDTDLNPVSWTWTALVDLVGFPARAFAFALPDGATVDLSTVQPIAASGGTPIVMGPQGPAGPTGPAGSQLVVDWAPSTAYVANQLVLNGGVLYRRISAGTSQTTFSTNSWLAVATLLASNTAAVWASANPVLRSMQEGVETDTKRRKLGDGATAWNSLPYHSYEIHVGTTAPANTYAVWIDTT